MSYAREATRTGWLKRNSATWSVSSSPRQRRPLQLPVQLVVYPAIEPPMQLVHRYQFVLIQPRTSPPKICKIFEKCIFEKRIFLELFAQSRHAAGVRRFRAPLRLSLIFPLTGAHGPDAVCLLPSVKMSAYLRQNRNPKTST